MYGLIILTVKDLVVTKFGEKVWRKICASANVAEVRHSHPDTKQNRPLLDWGASMELICDRIMYNLRTTLMMFFTRLLGPFPRPWTLLSLKLWKPQAIGLFRTSLLRSTEGCSRWPAKPLRRRYET